MKRPRRRPSGDARGPRGPRPGAQRRPGRGAGDRRPREAGRPARPAARERPRHRGKSEEMVHGVRACEALFAKRPAEIVRV
ncbi:MAG: hypothetical protein ACKON7_01175, partial [Planctomycetaceae bacterium]